jgi:hypothetical protein
MKKISKAKKLFWFVLVSLLFFSIFTAYTKGFLKKIDTKTLVSFAAENMHTGLVSSPVAQIAFNDSDTNRQFAVVIPENTGQQPEATKIPSIAMGERMTGGIPTQLFDIKLEFDQSVISKAEDIGLRVIFTSFGKMPTPVDMAFDILDASGKVLHSETDSTVVETEKVYNKKLSGFVLSAGKYTVRLTTLYDKNVKDEFRQAFEIVPVKSRLTLPVFWLIVLILASVVIISILIFFDKIFKKN